LDSLVSKAGKLVWLPKSLFTQLHRFRVHVLAYWKLGEKEPWFLTTNLPDPQLALRAYRCRMWIEEMYGYMKGHGLDLEATHLQDAARISRLFLGISIIFVWLLTLGNWVVKRGYRHFVDHKSRRDKSYFRLGWDWVERALGLNRPLPLRFKPYF
jgi:hypothetical protein